MGLSFLDGKSWWQVSRDERFFCAHLFHIIETKGVDSFIEHLNSDHGMSLDCKANWEAAYEACFYRDLWQHRNREGILFSPKRTFDLCFFSDDAIVVVEAKAHGEFKTDQLESFEKDKDKIKQETGVSTVLLGALTSSRYNAAPNVKACFNGPYLTWRELSEFYDDEQILKRADEIYQSGPAHSYGRNNISGYMKGDELAEAHKRGEDFFVGRDGGIRGPKLSQDITFGEWGRRGYETNRDAEDAPNANWFRLSEFMNLIEEKLKS